MSEDQDHIADLASAIEAYLDAHPAAADTAEGIARWWLVRQRVEHTMTQVDAALRLLLDRGSVTHTMAGSGAVYRRSTGRSRETSDD